DVVTGEQCDNLPFGLSGDGCTSTCSLELSIWRDITPRTPDARGQPALAFDERRGRTVLFGGALAGDAALGDTWEWDGTVWRRFEPDPAPPPRMGHRMAYDAARGVVVLVGGSRRGMFYEDTW